MFANPLTNKIVAFLREIGLEVRAGTIAEPTAVPGIDVDRAVLVVDESRMLYPGDLLHEAGHLAVAPPARRATFHHDVGNDPGEEMMAIAWSYAAALHIGIDPALVFHGAYKGGGVAILENFRGGHYFAVETLAYFGLTHSGKQKMPDGAKAYPAMIRWLCE